MASHFLRNFRELKQPRRQRQQKRYLKTEFALFQTLLLFIFHSICHLLGNFSGIDSKGLYLNSDRKNKQTNNNNNKKRFVLMSSIKRKTVVVVQRRQRNVQKKSDACAKLLFC